MLEEKDVLARHGLTLVSKSEIDDCLVRINAEISSHEESIERLEEASPGLPQYMAYSLAAVCIPLGIGAGREMHSPYKRLEEIYASILDKRNQISILKAEQASLICAKEKYTNSPNLLKKDGGYKSTDSDLDPN